MQPSRLIFSEHLCGRSRLNDQYTGSGGQMDFALDVQYPMTQVCNNFILYDSDLKYSRIVFHPSPGKKSFAPQLPLVQISCGYVVTEFGSHI